jgi:hypothetical protein
MRMRQINSLSLVKLSIRIHILNGVLDDNVEDSLSLVKCIRIHILSQQGKGEIGRCALLYQRKAVYQGERKDD